MSGDLSTLVSYDSRGQLDRMTRHQLHALADKAGVKYPSGHPKYIWGKGAGGKIIGGMVVLLESNEINPLDPRYAIPHVAVEGKDENGQMHSEVYPVIPEHQTARADINYDAKLEQIAEARDAKAENAQTTDGDAFKDARIAALENENAALNRIIEDRLSRLEEEQPRADPFGLEVLTRAELVQKAKAMGVNTRHLKKPQLIEAINGKNAS